MGVGEASMIAGIGCRSGVRGEQVEAAIDAAIEALGADDGSHVKGAARAAARRSPLTAIATPATKAHEPGIQAAAAARGVPLISISQPDLEAANPATVTRSAHSMAAMNVHSVAEAAALAGAVAVANAIASGNGATQPSVASRAGALATAGAGRCTTAMPRLLTPRVAVGPVTCALADTTPA